MPITTVLAERTAVPLAAPARVTMVIKVMIRFGPVSRFQAALHVFLAADAAREVEFTSLLL